jgi:hypothetical protein
MKVFNTIYLFISLALVASCNYESGGKSSGLIKNHKVTEEETPVQATVSINALSPINIANETAYSFSGACSVDAAQVTISIGALNLPATCSGGTYDTGAVDVSSVADGASVSVTANHEDANQATANVLKDTVAPSISATTITGGTYTSGNPIDVAITFDENVSMSGSGQIQLTFDAMNTTPLYANYFSGDGNANYVFKYTVIAGDDDADGIDLAAAISGATFADTAGNNASLNLAATNFPAVLIDSTVPTVSLTTPADSSYINIASDSAVFMVNGTCDQAGLTVVIKVDGGAASSPGGLLCDGASFSGTIDTTGLSEGAHTFVAELTNGAGTGSSLANSVTKDTVAPTLDISPAAVDINAANVSSYSLAGNCNEDGATVNISLGALNTTASCSGGSWIKAAWDVSAQAESASVPVTADMNDAAGNPATQATDNVIKDSVLPTVAIVTPADSSYINAATSSVTFAVSGTCNENGQTVSIEVDGGAATSPVGFVCDGSNFSGTIDTTGLTEGVRNLVAKISDANSNEGVSATNAVEKDTVIPNTAVSSPVDLSIINAVNDSATFAVNGTCDDNTLTVAIEIDGSAAAGQSGFSCDGTNFAGTIDTTGYADGDYDLTAIITDAAGNSTTSSIINLTKDVDVPTVAIAVPADSSYINAASDSATFAVSGTCNENGQTVSIEVDGGAAASPVGFVCDGTNFAGTIDTTGLAEGARSFVAKITDANSNEGVSSANSVSKDTIIPNVAVSSPVDLSIINAVNDSATFVVNGTCDDNTLTVAIEIDGSAAAGQLGFSCDGTNFAGTIDTTGYADADYDLTAIITDSAGNSTTSSIVNLTKDVTAPTVALAVPADSSYINIASDSATFAVSGTCNENGQTVSIEVDGGAAASPVGFVCDGTNFAGTIDTTGLAEGTRSFVAKITDVNSNEGVSGANSVTKDTVAPSVAVSSPVDLSSINIANDSATFAVNGTCDENTLVVAIEMDSAAAAGQSGFVCDGTNFAGTIDTTGYADADYDLTAVITDAAGNSTTSSIINLTKDATAPTVAISVPADSSFINIASDSATFAVSGTCNENGQTVSIEVDGGAAASPVGFVCDGTNFAGTIDTTGLAEGARSFVAKITDANSNEGVSAANSATKDTVAPTITLDAMPNINVANETSYAISGTCSADAGDTIDVAVGSETAQGSCSSGTYSINVDTSPVADGTSISVTADRIDAAGNTATQASTTVDKDATVPTVSITFSPDITAANVTSYSISGDCSENGRTVSVDIDGLSYTPTCTSGSWSVGPTDVSSRSDNASLPITADHDDAFANNATQASVTVDKNTVAPTVTITSSPDIDQANLTSYVVSGTCSENGVVVSVDVGGISKSPNCSSGVWATSQIDATSLLDGTVNITADHSTATQASTSVNKDTASATVTISSAPDISFNNQTTYIASGTCSENTVIVTVWIDTLSYTPTCTSGSWTTGQVDVSTLTDGNGLSVTADHSTATQASTTINKDTANPTVSSLSVSTTLTNSADIAWTLNDPGGFTINDYVINYRVKGSPTWLLFNDGVGTSTTSTVTGLAASTTYEFRVHVVYDTSNQSDWSNTAEGLTKPDDPLFGPNAAMNVGGATDTTVVAYQDSTAITLNGSALVTLNKGQTHRFTSAAFDVIDADKPIFTAGRRGSGANTSKGNIVWSPTAWAGKTFNFNATRENLQFLDVYAIEGTTIEVKQGSTVLDSATLAADGTTTLSWATQGSYQVYSTGNVLAFHRSGDGGTRVVDPKPLLPDAYEIIGFPSNSMEMTTSMDGTNYTALHSNSSSASGSLSKANVVVISPQGGTTSQYQSEALILSADQKIYGASYADSNGNCAAPFLPTNLMKTKYALPMASDWIAFASKTPGTIEVRDASDTLITTLTLSRSGANSNAPYKARMANPAQGYRFIATTPVGAWYQPNNDNGGADQDETIMYGSN